MPQFGKKGKHSNWTDSVMRPCPLSIMAGVDARLLTTLSRRFTSTMSGPRLGFILMLIHLLGIGHEPEARIAPSAREELCEPIHSRSWGITLACCSSKSPLAEHCKYNNPHTCKFPHCACTVIVDVDNVRCSDEAPRRKWRDHETSPNDEPFQCRNPNFPNENGEFVVTLKMNSKHLGKEFLLGLSKYKIIDVTLVFESVIGGNLVGEDLFAYFRLLKRVKIFHSSPPSGVDSRILDHPPASLGALSLEMLSLVNLSSLTRLPQRVEFESTLRYLLIQSCPQFRELPGWFNELVALNYLKITRTSLEDVTNAVALTALQFLYLPSNKIKDISNIVLESQNLQELDLSGNEICCIGVETFSKLSALKYLDLSDNPLKRLPSGGFVNLQNLQWLYLKHKATSHISLDSLTADVLAGLIRLEYLSLENNPNIRIAHQSFVSLPSLKSLDLTYCNLTLLPESIMHLCQLKFVWLRFNRLHYSSCFPPSTLAMLPLGDMHALDVSENGLAQNPHSFFLIPLENTVLMESLISALKHQPLWWHDNCARRHWRMRLIDSNPDQTLRGFYSQLLEDDTPASHSAAIDESQCKGEYEKIMRELEPYETLKDSTICSRLIEQRRLNRRFRQQLIMLQSSKNKEANGTNNGPCPPFISRGDQTGPIQAQSREGGIQAVTEGPDAVQRAVNIARQDRDDQWGEEGASQPTVQEDCGYLYNTIDILGYVLAANFAILISVSLCCIILICKRRRRAVEDNTG